MTSRPNTPTPTPTPTPIPDTTPPTSTITSPTEGAIVKVGIQVAITGTASDPGGGTVARVEVSVDGGGAFSAATGTNTWSFNWTPSAPGPVTIKSRAVDNAGNVQNPPAEIHVTVDAPPTSAITSPKEGATVLIGTTVNITGTASDPGGGKVVRVEVSVDGGATYSAATGTDAWSFDWTPNSPGPMTIKSRAVDNTGNVQDPPTERSVTVDAPPTSAITFPTEGAIVPAGTPVDITGTASDAGGGSVVRVEVSVDGGATYDTATGTNAWSFSWKPSAPGQVTIKSRAVDNTDNVQDPPAEISVKVDEPPRVVSVTPARGSTNESIGVAPAATFSEALDPDSLVASTEEASTVLLRDAAGALVPVTISYNADNLTVTLTPQQLLQRGQTYTVTLRGGGGPDDPHITDEIGIPLAADFVWSFTTAFSIFAPGETPEIPIADDPDAEQFGVELGLKFRSDIEGLITGVRFYKGGPENGGVHRGRLWTGAGTLLGSVTFSNETPSGWQQALFETPIPILANTTYVVSYFAPQGNYSATPFKFEPSGVDNPPLRALKDGFDGGNGVFRYGDEEAIPVGTFHSTNYFVDVVFNESGPLRILSTTPLLGATNVPTNIAPAARFSKSLDPDSLVASTEEASTVLLRDAAGALVPVDVSYNAGAFMVTLTPPQSLQPGQTYTVTLRGGPDEPHITDVQGTPLAADHTWSFTTESPPSSTQVTMLRNWVTAGGNFIAMQPDKLLACLLGISDESSVRSEAYLRAGATRETASGIVIKRLAVESVRLP